MTLVTPLVQTLKHLLLPLGCLLIVATASADQLVRDAQSELKTQGFFYGEADGLNNAETIAAVRRFQIRNGLEVTGKLNSETLSGLGVTGGGTPATPAPVARAKPPVRANPVPALPPAPRGPVNLRQQEPEAENDRRFLEQDIPPTRSRAPSDDPSVIRPPAPLDRATESEDYAEIFAGTPYASAPVELQEQTVRRAQEVLRGKGHYRDRIDGDAGPAMEEALLAFQRRSRLPLSGSLDLETLTALRLMPGRRTENSALKPFSSPSTTRRSQDRTTYRGVWIE